MAGRHAAVGWLVGIVVGCVVLVLLLVLLIVPWARRRSRLNRRMRRDVEQVSSHVATLSLQSPVSNPTWQRTSTLVSAVRASNDATGNARESKVDTNEPTVDESDISIIRSSYDEGPLLRKSADGAQAWDRASTTTGETGYSNKKPFMSSYEAPSAPQVLTISHPKPGLPCSPRPYETQAGRREITPPPVSYPPKLNPEHPPRSKAGLPRHPMEPLIEKRESSQSGLSNPTEASTRLSVQVPAQTSSVTVVVDPVVVPPGPSRDGRPAGPPSPVSLVPSHRLISAFERSPLTSNPSVSSDSKETVRSQTSTATTESAPQHALMPSDGHGVLPSITSSQSSQFTVITTPPISGKISLPRPGSENVGQAQAAAVLRSSDAIRAFMHERDDQGWPFRSSLHFPFEYPHIPSPPPYPPPTTPLPPTPRDDDDTLRLRLMSLRRPPSASLLMVPRTGQDHAPTRSRSDSGTRQSAIRPLPLPRVPQSPRAVSAATVRIPERPPSSTDPDVVASDIHVPEKSVQRSVHSANGELAHSPFRDPPETAPLPAENVVSLRKSCGLPSSVRPLSSPPTRKPSGPRHPTKRGRDAPFPVAQGANGTHDSFATLVTGSSTLPVYLPSAVDANTMGADAEMAPPPYSSPPDVTEFQHRQSPPPRIPTLPPMTPLTLRAITAALEHEPMPEFKLDDLQSKSSSARSSLSKPVLPSICTLSTLSLSLGGTSPEPAPAPGTETKPPESLAVRAAGRESSTSSTVVEPPSSGARPQSLAVRASERESVTSSTAVEPPSKRTGTRPQLAIETSFVDRSGKTNHLSWLRPPSPLRVPKRPRPSTFAHMDRALLSH